LDRSQIFTRVFKDRFPYNSPCDATQTNADRSQIFTRVFKDRFPYNSPCDATQTNASSDIQNLALRLRFGSIMLFSLFYSDFMYCFTFYGYFLCIFKSLFCFVVEVRFLAYLRFCKLYKDINFSSITFRENKAGNLRFTSTAPFAHQNFCVLCLFIVFNFYLHKKIHMSK
jgi:hypothetical protein